MKFEGTIPDIPKEKLVKTAPQNGIWKFPEKMGNQIYVGFIYLIRDNYLERFYLGKKFFRSVRGKNEGKEADWRNYKSSSKLLKEMFEHRTLDEFEFICLDQYRTKGTLAYAETWTLCHVEAPTNKRWYNYLLNEISWKISEPISERHKTRLHHAINLKPFEE
jgi:hypothetical protein